LAVELVTLYDVGQCGLPRRHVEDAFSLRHAATYTRRYFNIKSLVTRVTSHIAEASAIPSECNG
jgi:hypothetical protein